MCPRAREARGWCVHGCGKAAVGDAVAGAKARAKEGSFLPCR
jgi:hypothetical protein